MGKVKRLLVGAGILLGAVIIFAMINVGSEYTVTEEDLAYANEARTHMASQAEGFTIVFDELSKAQANQSYMSSKAFNEESARGLYMVTSSVESLEALARPSGKMGEVHDYLLKAGVEYRQMVDSYIEGIDYQDANAIEKATDHLETGDSYTRQASELVNEMTDEMEGGTND